MQKTKKNQRIYCDNLKLFDISHANSQELLKNEEGRQLLQLQRISRTGCIESLDRKLAECEKEKDKKEIKDLLSDCKLLQQLLPHLMP
ncbi:hypothetical protein AVEN_17132-1 [Araneus ventricosus]|uniref:Uncharacterized protein n=1 Tax=Araneus ventricosus TaxID=182803 RepID=A0A4Y2WVU7_ARAVE|nr:hypothetical protein AVEN_17132-1 [Araneus ventricosus]